MEITLRILLITLAAILITLNEVHAQNACSSGSCRNGGTCSSNDPVLYNCTCSPDWTGDVCQTRNFCHTDTCKNNGTCRNLSNRFSCNCVGPWSGRECTNYDPCREGVCLRESNCFNRLDENRQLVAKCNCRPGTYGEFCQFDTDECVTGDGGCVNGGTCINTAFSFRCDCPPPYSGRFCEIGLNGTVVDPCAADPYPCQNGGTCDVNQPWRVKCNCQPGWGGDFCERGSCTYESPIEDDYDYNYEEGPRGELENIPPEYAYQLNPEYCFFGSVCSVPDPSSLPTCDCPTGYHGPRCFYRSTILSDVSPVVGPWAGGTDILFRGINLNGTTDRPIVSVGDFPCFRKFGNHTLLVYTTPAVNASYVGVPQNLTIFFRNTRTVLDVLQDFTYRPNPNITSVQPTESIISGGVTLTVGGAGLDVVGRPVLQITVVYRGIPIHVFESVCTVTNSTQMLCPTPKLSILDADGNLDFSAIPPTTPEYGPNQSGPIGPPVQQRRRKRAAPSAGHRLNDVPRMLLSYFRSLQRHRRQADNTKVAEFKVNNETVEFYIGFQLDGVDTYRNLTETLPQYAKLTVYVDPEITPWAEQQVVTLDKNILEMEGKRLTTGIQETDYRVLIGSADCSGVEVFDNRIVCKAPTDTPAPHPLDGGSTSINVRVRIGSFKDPFYVGEVTYKTSFWDNEQVKWGLIGGGIALAVLAIIIIAILVARCTK